MVAATFQNATSQNLASLSWCLFALWLMIHCPNQVILVRPTCGEDQLKALDVLFLFHTMLLTKCKDFKIRNLKGTVRLIISTLLIKKLMQKENELTKVKSPIVYGDRFNIRSMIRATNSVHFSLALYILS